MPGRNKSLITRNGIPDPQAYNPQTGQWESFIGVSWGKTAGGLYVPIRVDDQGRQEVTLSGNIVKRFSELTTPIQLEPGQSVYTNTIDLTEEKIVSLKATFRINSSANFDKPNIRWEGSRGSGFGTVQETEIITHEVLFDDSPVAYILQTKKLSPIGRYGRFLINNPSSNTKNACIFHLSYVWYLS